MLTIKKFNNLIKNYLLENYHPKVFDKHYYYYLKFVEELLFKYASNNGLVNERNIQLCLENNSDFKNRIILGKYNFNLHYSDLKKKYTRRISTKYLNGIHCYNCKDIHLINIIKKDLEEIGILEKTKNRLPIVPNERYSQEQFTLNLILQEDLFSDSKVEFEYIGEFKRNTTSKFTFQLEDLMSYSKMKSISPRKFIRNYFILMKMNEEGFHLIHKEDCGREHHSLSLVSEGFRDIIVPQNDRTMYNYDLKSSHLFWLAELTGSKALYEDIKAGRLQKKYNKKTLLNWLNTSNFESSFYGGINELFFVKYGVDTSKYRDSEGSMYQVLAKMESEYIQSISKNMNYDNYTMHDQIYFDHKGIDNFFEYVRLENRKLKFEPIWVMK